MSNLSHVDISQSFNGHSDDYDGTPPKRKPERQGKPRAARENDIEARLYAITRSAVVKWQEGER